MELSPKNKLFLLIVSGLILFLLCFPLAINRTLEIRQSFQQLQTQAQVSQDLPIKMTLLKQKDRHYDSILSRLNMGSNSVQNSLIQFIDEQMVDESAKIIEFKKPHRVANLDQQSFTYQFKLKGSFSELLKTIYALEQDGNFGEVIHMDFEKKRNFRTQKERLEATVFIQQLK